MSEANASSIESVLKEARTFDPPAPEEVGAPF